jgi:hypothetical protein
MSLELAILSEPLKQFEEEKRKKIIPKIEI